MSVHQRLVWALLANISVHQRLVWALLANISVHQRFRKTALRASIPPPFLPQPKPWGRKGATRDQALGFRLWALGDQPNSPTRFISVHECSSAVGLGFISVHECSSAVGKTALRAVLPPLSPRPFSPSQSPEGERGPSGIRR
jgi:hypothetical protein